MGAWCVFARGVIVSGRFYIVQFSHDCIIFALTLHRTKILGRYQAKLLRLDSACQQAALMHKKQPILLKLEPIEEQIVTSLSFFSNAALP